MRVASVRAVWIACAMGCTAAADTDVDATEPAPADSGVADSGVAGSGVADSGVADSVPLDTTPGDSPDEGRPALEVTPPKRTSFLVVSRTAGYRHTCIEAGQDALIALGTAEGVAMDLHPDADRLDQSALSPHAGIVLLSTTGDFLDGEEQASLVEFIESGGRLLAVHAAADAEYDWPQYRALIGAAFARHPATQPAEIVVATDHPATAGLPTRFTRTDEWYDFQALPDASGDRVVLLRVDEATYEGGGMGALHPVAWVHSAGDGRVFYTAMGHTAASYEANGGADDYFLEHMRLGLRWLLAP